MMTIALICTRLTPHPSLYGTAYKFSRNFFTGWVIVSLLWAIFSFFSVTIYPIIEGRHLLFSWAKDLVGKGGKSGHGDEFDHHKDKRAVSFGDTSPEVGSAGGSLKAGGVGVREEKA